DSLLAASAARLAAAREDQPERWAEILAEPRVAETLPHVWACSEFVAGACLRSPQLLAELIADGQLLSDAAPEWFKRDLAGHAGDDEAQLMQALRLYRRKHMLRIAWRDIAGWAGLEETLRDLSALADA